MRTRIKKFFRPLKTVLFVIAALLCIGLVFVYKQFRPVTETPKSEVKTLPKGLRVETPISGTIRVPILMYHYVEYVKDKRDTMRQALDTIPPVFEEQVKTLLLGGYTFMTASELADVLDGKTGLPPKPVLLTFDDGYWDLYTDVLPILKKYHVKATAYIVPGFIDKANWLSKEQLIEVIQSGLVEIGAHTVHHISLAGKLSTIVQYEVVRSKLTLEQEYHIPIVSFAYPNGSFDQHAIDIVRQAGFRTSVSTIPGIEQSTGNRYFLYRLRPGGRVGDSLLRYLEQSTFRPW